MFKRLAIFCLGALISTGLLGCEAKTRYHALCFLFDGVPTPPGMVPCDGSRRPGAASAAAAASEKEVARTYSQHGPFAAKLCEGCHQRQTNRLLLSKEDLCLYCHVFTFKKKKVHGPVAAGGCTVCHDPHGSPNKYLLVAKSQEFCLYCHKREDILKSGAHQGMDETGCTTCHNAHASDNDYLLRESPGIEASPALKKHEASPKKEQHEAAPQKKHHEAAPEQKPPKQQFAQTAKASKIPAATKKPDKPEQNSDREHAPIKSGQMLDAKVF